MNRPFTDNEILNALDCCSDRPNRKCGRCPLFEPGSYKNCDNLEYWAYDIILEERRKLKTIRKDTATEIRDGLIERGRFMQDRDYDFVAVETETISTFINSLIERTSNESNFS